jgi:uncharacterized protein
MRYPSWRGAAKGKGRTMRYVKAGQSYLLRLDTGQEIFSALTDFAADRRIDTGTVSGIGSAREVVLGYYDLVAKEYVRRTVPDDVEIVSLQGTITIREGRPLPHLHVVLGDRECQALAGHFFEGRVAATCELVVTPLDGFVQRRQDEATGLELMDL